METANPRPPKADAHPYKTKTAKVKQMGQQCMDSLIELQAKRTNGNGKANGNGSAKAK